MGEQFVPAPADARTPNVSPTPSLVNFRPGDLAISLFPSQNSLVKPPLPLKRR